MAAAATVTTAAAILAATMPRRRPAQVLLRDAVVTVADADPEDGTPSDTYELCVHGVSVLVRLRAAWEDERNVPYVHIEHEAPRPRLLLVEVDNKGEHEHR